MSEIHPDETPPELSVVIPVYRSAELLPKVIGRLHATLPAVVSSFEIVLVEDGSPDATWKAVESLAADHPLSIVAIQLTRNFGQHNALMCGFRHSRGKIVVTIDDDLQTPPEEIPKLVSKLRSSGLDLVYGVYAQKRHSCGRNLGSKLVGMFYRVVFRSKVQVTSFRAMRRELMESIGAYDLNFTYIDGLLAWNTDRVGEVEVEHHSRPAGRSGYSLRRLVTLALNLFTNFSLLPLQIVSLAGFLAALLGLATGAYYLVLYFARQIVVPGYVSTIVAVLTLGGLQLLSLGMIGEYVGRLHLNVNRKPQYVVRQIQSGRSSATPRASRPE